MEPVTKRQKNEELEHRDVEISKIVASAEGAEVTEVGSHQVAEKLVIGLEKKINENIRQRSKHEGNPSMFMASEVDLDEHIKKMHVLATVPKFYPRLIKADFVNTLLGLITHENTDISVDTLALVNELIDLDNDNDNDNADGTESNFENIAALIDRFISKETNGLEVLVQNLERLREEDSNGDTIPSKTTASTEASGVYYTMNIMENILEYNGAVADQICSRTKLLVYLLKRIQHKAFDENKLYASEILSILAQTSTQNQLLIGSLSVKISNSEQDVNGVDALLIALSAYRKKDAASAEEEEFVGNVFEILCSVLMIRDNQSTFVQLEGMELLLRMIKARKVAYPFAVRTLKFAVDHNPEACERVIVAGGLKTVFPLFMAKGIKRKGMITQSQKGRKKKSKNKYVDPKEIEQTICYIISSLLQNLSNTSIHYKRIIKKFKDDSMEKVDRLVELHGVFVSALENNLKGNRKRNNADSDHVLGLEFQEMVNVQVAETGLPRKEAEYMVKLGLGYEHVQQSAVIMGHLICAGPELYAHIKTQLLQNIARSSELCTIPGITIIIKELANTMVVDEDQDGSKRNSGGRTINSSPLAVMHEIPALKHRLLEIASILEHENEWGSKN